MHFSLWPWRKSKACTDTEKGREKERERLSCPAAEDAMVPGGCAMFCLSQPLSQAAGTIAQWAQAPSCQMAVLFTGEKTHFWSLVTIGTVSHEFWILGNAKTKENFKGKWPDCRNYASFTEHFLRCSRLRRPDCLLKSYEFLGSLFSLTFVCSERGVPRERCCMSLVPRAHTCAGLLGHSLYRALETLGGGMVLTASHRFFQFFQTESAANLEKQIFKTKQPCLPPCHKYMSINSGCEIQCLLGLRLNRKGALRAPLRMEINAQMKMHITWGT